MISLEAVGVFLGNQQLFSDVTLRLLPGRRVALVGANGVGKTTLLEVVAGNREPTSGAVNRARGATIGYLPQEVVHGRGRTVLEETLLGAGEVLALEQRLRALEQRLADGDESVMDAYAQAQERYTNLGGYAMEAEAHRLLDGLGFATEDHGKDVGLLSGGWMMRVALARLLLQQPDVMLLDEPTNHLDLESVAFLESTLARYEGAVLFVSHDRDFIDAVAERVVELQHGRADEYVGDFSSFVEQRALRMEGLEAAAKAQQRKVEQTERFVERFRYKATKARQVQSRIKQLDKLERVETRKDDTFRPRFDFGEPPRAGRVVVELDRATKRFGDNTVWAGVDLVLERGARVALVGPNGAGKTTLMRVLLGELETDEGSARLGHNVETAFFAQHQVDQLDLDRTVLAEFADGLPERFRGRNLRSLLGPFGFTGDDTDKLVKVLSGGERSRLALAKVVARNANLLCLDEPTNHLDMASRDVLEDALLAYPGTVVVISHDRHLLRQVANTVVEVRGGHASVLTDTTFEDWQASRARAAAATSGGNGRSSSSTGSQAGAPSRKRDEAAFRQRVHAATKDLRRAVQRVERDLLAAEEDVARLTREMADPAVYGDEDEVKALVKQHATAKELAASLMGDWEQAQEKLDRAVARVEAGF